MDIQLINDNLLSVLHWKAKESDRQRQNFDLRTTPEDGSQRMLNVLEPGTHVPIHRHLKTSETVVCLEGSFDEIFYEELPSVDCGGPIHDGERALDERQFAEVAPAKDNMASRSPQWLGTPWKSTNPARYSRPRTGRAGRGDYSL